MRRLPLVALLLSCAHGGARVGGPSAFAGFVDEYYEARFAWAPSEATALGMHQYDDRLEDFSRGRIDRRIAELKAFRQRLAGIDRAALPVDDRIDADLIEGDIEGDLLELEVIRGWERNPMLYARLPGESVDVLLKRDFAPAPDRLRAATSRLRQVPGMYEAARRNVREPPKEYTDLAIRMAKGSAAFFDGPVATWGKEAAGDDRELAAAFARANEAALAAAKAYVDWLEKDLAPRSTGKYAIGAETFARKLRYDDRIDLPLPELLARGQAQLDKDHRDFIETARKIDARKPAAEVMTSLSAEHPSADDLIPFVRRSVEAAREFVVQRDIVTVPSPVRVRVQETPSYARSGSFASMDTPGPFETRATQAYYYVTPVEPEWDAKHREEHLRAFNAPVVAMINVHEAYPGHYLQFLYAPRFPTKARKLADSPSNAEGWAHYAEQMMVDQGFGGGEPRIRLAQLAEALVRDCRYVVGIQLHTAGWTVAQGTRLFEEKCFQEPANAFEEARRGTYDPTYLYYTYGKLEIQALAREYMEKKGATLKQFHDAFVTQGAVPIPLARTILLGP